MFLYFAVSFLPVSGYIYSHIVYIIASEDADVSSGAGGRETLGDEPGRIGRRSM